MPVLAIVLCLIGFFVQAHEVRPGYLEITEITTEHFSVVWKQPVRDQITQVAGLGLRPVFPSNCERRSDSQISRRPGVLIEHFLLDCSGGLSGQSIAVEGLQKTITDVFVRLVKLDGDIKNLRLTADQPIANFAGATLVSDYFKLGIEHLLFGYDHILFIILLIFLVKSFRQLIVMVTCFTLAHSFTLAASIFSLITLPSAPVEAAIALSILFVARELLQPEHLRSSLAAKYSYSVAFIFGLLHGFGFAGVLTDIGLPQDQIAWALALFNLGLEVGQLIVIALVSVLVLIFSSTIDRFGRTAFRLTRLSVFVCGATAAYWFIQRALTIAL